MPMHDALIVTGVVAAFIVFAVVLFTLERSERKLARQAPARSFTPAAPANMDQTRRAA